MLGGPSSQPSQTELEAYSALTRLEVYKGFGLAALLWCAPFAVQAAQSTLANLI
ncbi:hypothetical protein SAICODRAFT_118174 [Saitoella complicata NRRL Y-17804]|uniref:uncharacterized protein n=1 Tax=Saitoella complicata (strain BCRC 22490 / CBS 7301 / JCM 7358 / NBRC 10748 / NRRL Y-17804) TaxID=698492 RepID=UPI000867ED62|nr:uncharacterized protein SAICODRAFT_118174 [Saitoella complicata NRRL Y-17804]ODQ53191.1 hypothetical protein SAICODRAFT_118174 [Saitoella complicata NRRL Y-17804]